MTQALGVLLVGSKGAVATTVQAAWAARRAGLPIAFSLPSQTDPAFAKIPLVDMADMVFGGWDVVGQSGSNAARRHGVVPRAVIDAVADTLDAVPCFPGIRLAAEAMPEPTDAGPHVGRPVLVGAPLRPVAHAIRDDIRRFQADNVLSRVVVVNLCSTEPLPVAGPEHDTIEAFEAAIDAGSPRISTGMIYAWAALSEGCPFVNFTPSVTFDIPALLALAIREGVPLAGKDGKTGQTLYKTVIAPMLRQRGLRVKGWFSTNILGNQDGLVLNDPEHVATKRASKLSVLPKILGYDDFEHQVNIHYYPPRGDAKEAWDNVDFEGWFGVPMQIKINWLGWDSILAAPLVVDLVRWMDFFDAQGEAGLLPHLASYFKHPLGTDENSLFDQVELLRRHLR